MKGCLVLLLLLLGTVSALYLEKDVPHLGDLETQADLSQDSEGSGGQEGELALSGEVLESGREEAEDTHDDEGASDPDDLDEDVQCPKEEETVQLPGSPECKTCRYRLVGTPRRFKKAQRVCRKCYRGNLASIHNFNVNLIIHRLSTTTNYGQVWIGGFIRGRGRPGARAFLSASRHHLPHRASSWPQKPACADVGDVMTERFSSSPVFSGFTLAA
ncbi:proteoglycan 3 [Bos mutus]|uniref:proteoglycan 3 n=1 Tax=Bos mutus TaxID=72004 RepID=UPI0038B585D5